jgi:hypothetical protein
MSKMSIHEFSFANAMSIHRIAPGCSPPIKPQHFRRLNEAHSNRGACSFLVWWWALRSIRLG